MASLTPNGDQEVSISIQGKLHRELIDENITGTGNFTVNMTVPVGKRWVFKAVQLATSNGVYTINNLRVFVVADGGTTDVELHSVGVASLLKTFGEQDITLQTGDVVRFIITCSAWTSIGNYRCRILVQEMDSN